MSEPGCLDAAEAQRRMSEWRIWESAFLAFVQDDDGKPLAALLRGVLEDDGTAPIPIMVVGALAELLDPQNAWNHLARARPVPPDEIEIVNGMPRLRAAVELEAARKAAQVARAPLFQAAKKSGKSLDTLGALEKFARANGDQEALRACADWRKADAKLQAVKKRTHNAVRLTTKPLTRPQVLPKKTLTKLTETELRERNILIMCEMLGAIQQQDQTVSDAARSIGKKFKLTERQVTQIWGDARKAHPKLLANLPRAKMRRTHTC